MSINIEQITPELTLRIRKDAMYPDREIKSLKLSDDDQGIHFGLFCDGELCTVLSWFRRDKETAQFRKFATIPSQQGKGYGRQMLDYVINFSKEEGIKLLWCNVRKTALGFYLHFGFKETGKSFEKDGKDYIILELEIE